MFFSQAICLTNPLRKSVLPSTIARCDQPGREKPLRVLVTVNKGGSVFGARVAHGFAWSCGWCPGFGHNKETIWPPQPDFLPTYDSDMYLALPISSKWEQYAYANSSRPVKCVVFTRDPLKRFKSLFQYAWEGGEPALWEAQRTLHALKTWKERVDWSWKNFGKGSMEVTHEVMAHALKRKECQQIKFEEFTNNYDQAMKKWLEYWEVDSGSISGLMESAAAHDLNRLTPEQRAKHNHVSGYSLSKQDAAEVAKAFAENEDLVATLKRESQELGY